MHLGVIAIVFGFIFLAELPDKSMVASLVLGSKFRPLYVWCGAAAAFLTHVIIAVTAGKLLTLLPHTILEIIIACLFIGGAMLLFFGEHETDNKQEEKELESKHAKGFWRIFGTAFVVIFIGEWGDITQIATANYAAKYHDVLSVAIGATLGLWTVSAIGIAVGTRALTLIPPKVLQRVTGTVLLLFGLYTIYTIF